MNDKINFNKDFSHYFTLKNEFIKDREFLVKAFDFNKEINQCKIKLIINSRDISYSQQEFSYELEFDSPLPKLFLPRDQILGDYVSTLVCRHVVRLYEQ